MTSATRTYGLIAAATLSGFIVVACGADDSGGSSVDPNNSNGADPKSPSDSEQGPGETSGNPSNAPSDPFVAPGAGGALAGAGGAAGAPPPRAMGSGGALTGAGGAPSLEPNKEQGDRFEDVGTNPFTLAAHDPQSTFAADVDTASYDIFVRDMGFGHLPVPSSVRLEEWVNYFSYDYPDPGPDAPHPFSISVDAAPSVLNGGTVTLRVGIQGTKPPPFEKKPANVVFLVDVSGSMQSAEKLPLVKTVLLGALDVLDPTDTISVVTYASGTQVQLAPTPAGDRTPIETLINGLTAGGSTNGAGGIQLAYQQAEAAFIEDGINHIVLCTDGDFNVGASSNQALIELIEEKRTTGVTFTALGFGTGNLNDSMMEAVSNAGNGIYSVIANADRAERYAEERLLATLEHIAKDMKIQVEFNPDHVHAYRLLGYENRAIADELFRDDTVDAGEIGEGHRVTALYELVLAGDPVPEVDGAPEVVDGAAFDGTPEVSADDLVLVKVRYKAPGASEQDSASEVSAALAPGEIAASRKDASGDLQWALGVAAFAEVLKHSPYADVDGLVIVDSIVAEQAGEDPDRLEFQTLYEQARSLLP